MTHLRLQLLCSLLVLSLAGCGKQETPEAAPSAKPALESVSASASAQPADEAIPVASAIKPFVPSHEVPAFRGAFPHREHPQGANATRVVELRFARKGGESDVSPLFSLKNLTKETVRVGQTWLFYYDAAKQKSDRYPHSLSYTLELGPGETKEERLGRSMKDIPSDLTAWEGEVTSAFVGGRKWVNDNLNPMPRPAGGVTDAALMDGAGERVIVDVYSLTSYKVRLTNVTDRVVKGAQISLHYGDAKGSNERVSARTDLLKEPLAPGQSVDLVLEPWFEKHKRPPAKASAVAAFASRVEFSTGPEFRNENLDEDFIWPKPAK
ncbi:MAG: hypothetical protein R3B13_18650 [Polyangiaceae bacterium]